MEKSDVAKLVANQDKFTVQPEVSKQSEVIEPTRTFKPKASAQPFELAPGVVLSDGTETKEAEKIGTTESSRKNQTSKGKVNPHFMKNSTLCMYVSKSGVGMVLGNDVVEIQEPQKRETWTVELQKKFAEGKAVITVPFVDLNEMIKAVPMDKIAPNLRIQLYLQSDSDTAELKRSTRIF